MWHGRGHRKIIVKGKTFFWRYGGRGVIIRDADGYRLDTPSPSQKNYFYKSDDPEEEERAHHKGYDFDRYCVTPGKVAEYIKGELM